MYGRKRSLFKICGLVIDKATALSPLQRAQKSFRPLFAAMRMRKALSLMKPAASAWL